MIVRICWTERLGGGWEAIKDGNHQGTDVYFWSAGALKEAREICRALGGGEIRVMSLTGSVVSVEKVNADDHDL